MADYAVVEQEYEDSIVGTRRTPHRHEDSENYLRGFYRPLRAHPVVHRVAPSIVAPTVSRVISEDQSSMKLVVDNIVRAPFAYFRFAATTGFLFFVFSLVFYLVFRIILFNPVLAVFGAVGALLTRVLVEVSLFVERNRGVRTERSGF